jgi:putative hydrolase of the HAD superfamily
MIKAILFDLDGTLYKSTEIRKQFAEAAYATLAKFKKISTTQAQKLIEDRREELKKKQGFPVPYTLTLASYGVPIELWHEENIKYFDPRNYLSKDERLGKILENLRTEYKLAILTNNNDVQTKRVLEALGIDGLFDKIFTYNSFKILKPNPEFFKKAAGALEVKTEECLVVGDRYNVDLDPAKGLNMKIFEVKGPEDICKLPDSL